MPKILSQLLFASVISLISFAQTNSANGFTTTIFINNWLKAGPIKIKSPVLDDKFSEKDLVAFEHVSVNNLSPPFDKEFVWNDELKFNWERISAEIDEVKLSRQDENDFTLYYLASFIDAKRWIKAKLEIASCAVFQVYVDRKIVLTKNSIQSASDTAECNPENSSAEIELEPGKHTLVIKTLSGGKHDWKLKTAIVLDSSFRDYHLRLTTDPRKFVTVENLLEDPKLGEVSISADGNYAAAVFNKNNPDAPAESWLNIYDTKEGKVIRTFAGGMKISGLKWLPQSNRFSYQQSENGKSNVWLYDISDGTAEKLFSVEENLGSYRWSPDESFLIYSINEKEPENKSGIKKLNAPHERLPNAKTKSYLYKLNYPSLTKLRITAGEKSTTINDISPDGKQILFSITNYDLQRRPFSSSTYYLMDLKDFKADSLLTLLWANSVSFSPDGKKLLFLGGPSLFGSIGVAVEGDVIPNDYDTQAYIYDLESRSAASVSRDFSPSIEDAYWAENNLIYFRVEEKTFHRIYKYEIISEKYEVINSGVDVAASIDFASAGNSAVFKGSSAVEPEDLYFINLESGKVSMLDDPDKQSYENISLGKSEEWNFVNDRGEEISGLVYYPPDFDPYEKYPLIVYFYGGTNPTEQAFEGRYPRNVWAANGYLVYVLQPSGATGFGQKFSSYHVNDWGEKTADEIINGTKKFLAEHDFVDPKRVGCIGASYGGFMTMNVITKTDLFSAAISHAGISSLASYWGEGYWGYSYNAVAAADSYPWNRKDIYVDKSPLFNADKITTPLLLLHGNADTNVPVGESIQMFTALKLLGRQVDLIQVEEQDHHILEYKKRMKWTKTIIAYFDKYLKGEPQWFDNLYPEK